MNWRGKRARVVCLGLIVAFSASKHTHATTLPEVEKQRAAKAAIALAVIKHCQESDLSGARSQFLMAEQNRGMDDDQLAAVGVLIDLLMINVHVSRCSPEGIQTAHGIIDELAR